jgi:release factor glutamine methyltransferase
VSASAEPWTIGRVLRWAAEDFGKRTSESPRLDAEVLLASALDSDRVRLVIESERVLEANELSLYRSLIERRRRGEPVAYILGRREFYGLDLVVDSRALVPRPDSEILVEVAIERTRARSQYGRALDLCTGSGCVAIAFAKARPTWRVSGTDVSPEAVMLAAENVRRHGVAHSVATLAGDLFEPVAGERFELVTANPPYVPSAEIAGLAADIRDFEPHQALDGGPDGLDLVRAVIAAAPEHLVPGGVLALEVGFDQAERVTALFEQAGFGNLSRRRDYGGHERVVSGQL